MADPVVHCVQHSERVRALTVAEWASARSCELRVVRVDLGDALPDPASVERLVVLGGQMNTDQVDAHPWLATERDWLTQVVGLGRARVLGICLGSQLLAEVLGGAVGRAETPEIGWQRIELTDAGRSDRVFGALPDAFHAMEWHGDAWVLPRGARLLATSDDCTTQAFAWGDRIHGVQFHPEFTQARTRELVATTTDDLTPRGAIQSPDEFLSHDDRWDALRELCTTLLDRSLLAPIDAPARAAVSS